MDRTTSINWPIEQEYDITAKIYGGSPGSGYNCLPENSFPPEDPEVDDIKIELDGKPLPEAEWERHGFTNDVIQQVKDELIEKAGKDAEAEASGGE